MLARWNVLGTQPDAKKAHELYRRASEAGYAEAAERADTTIQNRTSSPKDRP
jgi:TPR repeat protein